MSGIKQDWLERQIEAIGKSLAALLFGKDKVKKVFEELKESHRDSNGRKIEDMLLDVLIDDYLEKGEFLKAEKTLFSFMENEKTLGMFMSALSFYNRLLDLDDSKLEAGGFSQKRINQGIEKLKEMYGA